MIKAHLEFHVVSARAQLVKTVGLYCMLEEELAELAFRTVDGERVVNCKIVDTLAKISARKIAMLSMDPSKFMR